MAIYMIGYDLHPVKGENYDGLFAALEAVGTGYWDCLEFDMAYHNGKDAGPNKERNQTVP